MVTMRRYKLEIKHRKKKDMTYESFFTLDRLELIKVRCVEIYTEICVSYSEGLSIDLSCVCGLLVEICLLL